MKEITIVACWESTHTLTVDDDIELDNLDLADDQIDLDQLRAIVPDDAEFLDWRLA